MNDELMKLATQFWPLPKPQTLEWRNRRRDAIRKIRRTGMKLEAVARLFGVHHSTVLYACNDGRRDKCRERGIAASRKRGSVELSPIDQVKRKLAELRKLGVGIRSICAVTGCSPRSLARIRNGTQTRIHPENAARILAMDESCIADRGLVPAKPTWALLQELIADGWLECDLAVLIGCKAKSKRIYIGLTNTSARTAMRVRRMYDDIRAGKVERKSHA